MSFRVLAVVLMSCGVTCPTSASEPELPADVREALDQNAAQVIPFDIALSKKRQMYQDPEEFARRIMRPVSFARGLETEMELRTLWRDSRFYTWRQRDLFHEDGVWRKETFEQSCDGRIMYSSVRTEPLPPMFVVGHISTKSLLAHEAEKNANMQTLDTGFFVLAGIELPAKLRQVQQKEPPQSRVLHLLEQGGKLRKISDRENVDGRELTRIEIVTDNPVRASAVKSDLDAMEATIRKVVPEELVEEEIEQQKETTLRNRELPERWVYVFHLDPQLNYAVVRTQLEYEDGTILEVIECSEFQELEGRKVFLPGSSKRSTAIHRRR